MKLNYSILLLALPVGIILAIVKWLHGWAGFACVLCFLCFTSAFFAVIRGGENI